jgi:N-glycosylase/DNA lyase
MKTSLLIDLPDTFSFRATAYSHGWCELKPFQLDEENCFLDCVITDVDQRPVPVSISEDGGKLRIEMLRQPASADKVISDVRHILRLDDDMADFYQAVKDYDRLSWVSKKRAGRLLRSATVFEDLVKTLCTTNCSWGLTKIMVSNLVEKLGESSPEGRRAFPTAAAMADVPPDFYRNEIKAGYRSPYFAELAERVASGGLDPESWLHSDLPTPELKKEMKKIKGVGDYAAENLLKLVGRYDGLALDSWLRAQFYKTHNNEKPCPDKKIEKHYKRFGKWGGLAIWCDMTERWHA